MCPLTALDDAHVANMVGMGTRAQLSSLQTNVRSRFQRAGPSANAVSVASDLRPDIAPGRWLIETRHRRKPWEVIVEPDADAQLLIVITAYPVES